MFCFERLCYFFNSFPTYVAKWSARGPPWESVTKNLRYFRFPPNLDSVMISSLANYRPFFSSFPHTPPPPPRESFVKLAKNMRDCRNGRCCRGSVYLLKIRAKSFGDGIQDICKYIESNLEPVAGF